jgi:hypothetical protein
MPMNGSLPAIWRVRWIAILVGMAGLLLGQAVAADGQPFRTAVEADWDAQEVRLERSASDPAAIRAALERGERLLEKLGRLSDTADLRRHAAALTNLRRQSEAAEALDQAARLELYRNIRWTVREAATANPLVGGQPIVFLQRRRFLCQMLHEYIAYYGDYGDIDGGGVFLLKQPGKSPAVSELTAGQLARGNYVTLALSYDARQVYFAFAERAEKKPDFYSPERRTFHIHAMDVDGGNLRPLTSGPHDNFDPCPLPDGGIAFMSSRRGGFVRCNNAWEPLPTHTLHRMDADGGNIRTLSFHETPEWHPSVLNDGRIVYIRWDYIDRSAAHHHGLWVSQPDGSAVRALFGNHTWNLNACYQPRAVPGSNKILFVAGAHHAVVGGSLVLFDPARAALDPISGEDRFESLEVLTPEICFAEVPNDAPRWPSSYFHSPWPLSEDFFLAAFSFDPLPGMGSGVDREPGMGLYYFDRFGNIELLYRAEGVSCMYPIPLTARRAPPALPSTLDPALGDEAELIVADVRQSLLPLPDDRPVRELRIFQVLPKSSTHVANQPRIGYANAENARMLLGTVPVEKDGSAHFRVPAGKPIYFQAVDERGSAVQTMRSIVYLQPGERRSCVGCHEATAAPQPSTDLAALRRPPSIIQPGPDGTQPMSFPRLVQPVLDRHCTGCHDGSAGPNKGPFALTGEPDGQFSRSYEALRPFVRWYEWGGESIDQISTRPGSNGAVASPLSAVLDGSKHAERFQLTDEERQRFRIWLDGNAPFYGSYSTAERQAQRAGRAIAPPQTQ